MPSEPAGLLEFERSQIIQGLITVALEHHRSSHLIEAARLYRQALELDPKHAESLHLLGMTEYQIQHHDLAEVLIVQAIKSDGTVALYHSNLGNALAGQARIDEAIACYRRALELNPDFAYAHHNLGNMLRGQGRLEEAVCAFRRAADLLPDLPEIHLALGAALQAQQRLEEAVSCYRRATSLRPECWEGHGALGLALAEQGRLVEAIVCYGHAINFEPGYLAGHFNLGKALRGQERLDEAIVCFRNAIALAPDNAESHFALATTLLARGNMTEGWEEFEWRWKTHHMIRYQIDFAEPRWHGETAPGKTLLIYAEQGFGDTLEFCRFAPLAAARGVRVVVVVPEPLVRLLQSLPEVDCVVVAGKDLPTFDFHCPMMSLPLALGITVVPSASAYLHADRAQVPFWRSRLAAIGKPGPVVGLVWSGNPRSHASDLEEADRLRSVRPERLFPLFELSGIHFVSLQKYGPKPPGHFSMTDLMDEMTDFADTAALIANIDLVISVDTAVAHLAAALGKPVWLLVRSEACWRWLTERRDSPWYPTVRLYRQRHPGDWDDVLVEVADDLRRFLSQVNVEQAAVVDISPLSVNS